MAQAPPQQPTSPPQPPMPYPPPGAAPPYGYAPPPKKDNTMLIVVVIVVVVILVLAIAAIAFIFLLSAPIVNTNTPPLISFGQANQVGGNVTVGITSASRAVAFAFFKVNLGYAGVAGIAETLLLSPSYATISISGNTFRLYFQDTNSNFAVDSGDAIRITGDNAALPAGNYSIYLLWSITSSVIVQRNFAV